MASEDFSHEDRKLMAECLELAKRAEGRTAPNPLVGAVIVDGSGQVLGKGFHRKAGEAHAETEAFNQAGDRCRGGTLYVNLEPCCHHGRTPPCSERVIASGVARVVIGMLDPNPLVAGKGADAIKQAGIHVTVGVLEQECRWLNRAFIQRMTRGRPWVILKMAATLDGRIADRTGASRWITGSEARAYVHALRNKTDCILIGGATAEKDNPLLNVREIENSRDPLKAVVDPELKLKPENRLFSPPQESAFAIKGISTYLFSRPEKIQSNKVLFPDYVKLIAAQNSDGKLDLSNVLSELSKEGVLSVLCEGGGRLAAALLESRLVDEIHWLVAPDLLVDEKSISSLAGTQPRFINNKIQLDKVQYRQLGKDMLVTGLAVYGEST